MKNIISLLSKKQFLITSGFMLLLIFFIVFYPGKRDWSGSEPGEALQMMVAESAFISQDQLKALDPDSCMILFVDSADLKENEGKVFNYFQVHDFLGEVGGIQSNYLHQTIILIGLKSEVKASYRAFLLQSGFAKVFILRDPMDSIPLEHIEKFRYSFIPDSTVAMELEEAMLPEE